MRSPADLEGAPEPPAGVGDLTENWPAFRRAVRAGDEVWSCHAVCGDGAALVRQGRVLKWFVTELVS